MRTRIKTLAAFAVIASTACIAGAQEQPRKERSERKPQEFKCPVCGSPCVSKAEIAKQVRTRQARMNHAQAVRPNRPEQARRLNSGQAPAGRKALPPRPHNRQQHAMRFDIDGDGKLSPAERAARRAYVQTMREHRGEQTGPRRPVEE